MDFNRMVRAKGNKKIVNWDVINNPDRNIDDIVINCYSNLRAVKMAAYDIDYAKFETEFSCFFKAQIDKIKSKYKDKVKVQFDGDSSLEYTKMILNLHGSSMSIDVKALDNNYKILKIKYFLDPVKVISPKYILHAVEKTLAMYKYQVANYSYKLDDSYQYLLELQKEYTRLDQTGEVPAIKNPNPKNNMDLFIKEQIVLLPVYNNDYKYVIDGIKYYGVFNNCLGLLGVITKKGSYGFKVFKDSQIYTKYMSLYEDVVFVNHYKSQHNLWHMVTQKDALKTPMEEVFPQTDDPVLKNIFEKTYEHARQLEANDPQAYRFKIKVELPDPTKDKNGRANLGDKMYVKKLFSALKEYLKLKDKPELVHDKTRQFEFLGSLEEEIYTDINKGALSKNMDLETALKRINISPLSILTLIKRGSSNNSNQNIMFTSTSTEPNPFDIFYLFGFMKTTQHTNTRSRKKSGSKKPEESKWLKYSDAEYLAEFAPKSEENIGKSTNLKFSINSDCIVRRKSIAEVNE